MKTFAIMTLGCKVNDYESAYVKNKLSEEYEMVDFKEKSDIYIIFFCFFDYLFPFVPQNIHHIFFCLVQFLQLSHAQSK